MPDDPTSCLRWVVKTEKGYLRRTREYPFEAYDGDFEHAILFPTELFAKLSAPGIGKVLPVSVKLIPEFHSDG